MMLIGSSCMTCWSSRRATVSRSRTAIARDLDLAYFVSQVDAADPANSVSIGELREIFVHGFTDWGGNAASDHPNQPG